MKKLSLLFSFLLGVLETAFAFSFSSRAKFKICNNRTIESLGFLDEKVSNLDWQNYFEVGVGLDLKLEHSGAFLEFSSFVGAPSGCGATTDYDFKDGSIIRYSQHENHLDKDMSVSLSLGYEFLLGKVVLSPSVGCEYNNIKHSAWSGYLQEPKDGFTWTGEEEKQRVTGNGISYEQQIILPFATLGAGYLFSNSISAGIALGYCPYVYADCLDSHYARAKQFYDMIRGGYSLCLNMWLIYERYRFSIDYRHTESSENSQTFQSKIGLGSPSQISVNGYIPGFKTDRLSISVGYSF